MEPINFIYWLQGYLELSGGQPFTSEQVQIVQDHINLVLEKKTPERKLDMKEIKLCGGPLYKSPPDIIRPDVTWAGTVVATNDSDLNKLLNHQNPPASC